MIMTTLVTLRSGWHQARMGLCVWISSACFPRYSDPYLEISILQRAIQNGLVEIHNHNIRDWTIDRHHTTDDVPYGGGGGMVMKVDPVFAAVEDILGKPPACPVILMTPQGRVFDQKMAYDYLKPGTSGDPLWPV